MVRGEKYTRPSLSASSPALIICSLWSRRSSHMGLCEVEWILHETISRCTSMKHLLCVRLTIEAERERKQINTACKREDAMATYLQYWVVAQCSHSMNGFRLLCDVLLLSGTLLQLLHGRTMGPRRGMSLSNSSRVISIGSSKSLS